MSISQPDPLLLGTHRHCLLVMRCYYSHYNSALLFSLLSAAWTNYFCSNPVLTIVDPNEVLFKRTMAELLASDNQSYLFKKSEKKLKKFNLRLSC